jgi:hypothetical protein
MALDDGLEILPIWNDGVFDTETVLLRLKEDCWRLHLGSLTRLRPLIEYSRAPLPWSLASNVETQHNTLMIMIIKGIMDPLCRPVY